VTFDSFATDLASQTTNKFAAVFLRDLKTGTTRMVSVNQAGTANGGGDSGVASITPDGHFVVFESNATDLVATADTNGEHDVYVRDLKAGTTTLVSINQAGNNTGDQASFVPAISDDSRFVAFESDANNLVGTDSNKQGDVFVRDLQ
jgi:Tol biopolymer transport system component